MKRIIIVISIVWLTWNCHLCASDSLRWQAHSDIGIYEGFAIGAKYHYRPNLGISITTGSQFMSIKKQQYWTICLSHDWTFRRPDQSLSAWSLNKKVFLWYLEDNWYQWKVLSMEPALARTWKLSQRLNFQIDAGPVFMVVLGFKRKTFEEVGWPTFINFNATAKISYTLDFK